MTTEIFEHTFPVEGSARLIVKNIRGSVTITPGDDGEIKVKAVKHLNTGYPEDTEIEIAQKPDGVVKAAVDYQAYGFFRTSRPSKVDFEIIAPPECAIRLKTVSARSAVSGFQGDFELKTVSGKMELQGLSGDISAKSVSGKITASDLSGPADLDTVSGAVKVTGSQIPSLSATSVSGSIFISTPLAEGPYRFSTVSGSTKLIISEEVPCAIKASSVSGSFKTDMTAKHLSSSRRRWQLQIGEGGPDITMKSVSGSMRVLTSENAVARSPRVRRQSREDRIDILSKLEKGEISVEDTISKLSI